MAKKSAQNTAPALIRNDALPTIFVDHLRISLRTDGFAFIHFLSRQENGLHEESRMMIHSDHLQGMLDVLCRTIDHYPAKKEGEK